MHGFSRANLRRLNTGIFWMSLLFVVPNCTNCFDCLLEEDGSEGGSEGGGSEGGGSDEAPGSNLAKGDAPFDDLIFCDIAKVEALDATPQCATDEEIQYGISLSDAAIALAEGRSSAFGIGLDYSQAALNDCGGGPKAIYFQGPFPQGYRICLNCAEAIGISSQPTVTAACQKQCLDFFGATTDADGNVIPDTSPDQATIDFCAANAKASTNMPNDTCFLGACSNGAVVDNFLDPRRLAEPVIWTDHTSGVTIGGPEGNDLIRQSATTLEFDEGAVSSQWITKGNGFVEFSATAGGSVIVGLSEVPNGCTEPADCPDADGTATSIKFGLLVRYDGVVFLSEAGADPVEVAMMDPLTPAPRFRIYVREQPNGTALVEYAALVGQCEPGTECNKNVFHTSTGIAHYPLRVDSSLFHQNAKITKVEIVRIQ